VYALSRFIRTSDLLFRYTGLSPLVIALSAIVMRLTGSKRTASDPHWQDPIGTAMAEGHASGAITHFQSVMADRVMRIGQVKVRDVMVPMDRVIKADDGIGRDRLIELYRRHDVSRIPLMRGQRSVAGLLDVYDALTSDDHATPREMMTEPTVLSGETSVDDALLRMQTSHAVMAVVADRKSRHVGIVTMKDLVEEIVGELEAW
jgi:CBS domain containing-hemolysin-like protein